MVTFHIKCSHSSYFELSKQFTRKWGIPVFLITAPPYPFLRPGRLSGRVCFQKHSTDLASLAPEILIDDSALYQSPGMFLSLDSPA